MTAPSSRPRRNGRDKSSLESVHALRLLEQIERNPDATQAALASRLGVAIGTVNWYVRRLTRKGFVKIRQVQRRRVRYLITPKGISEKSKLAYEYVRISMNLYRATRAQARQHLDQVSAAGYARVRIAGDGEIADICRLTCLERNVMVDLDGDKSIPCLEIEGSAIVLKLPDGVLLPQGGGHVQVSVR